MNRTIVKALVFALPLLLAGSAFAGAGSIYTTTSPACSDKVNVFGLKTDVYIKGSGLPDGSYYVLVTEPGGTVVGKSLAPNVVVSGGNLAHCYQVTSLVVAAPGFVNPGFADTSNPAPNYKVLISTDPSFRQTMSSTTTSRS